MQPKYKGIMIQIKKSKDEVIIRETPVLQWIVSLLFAIVLSFFAYYKYTNSELLWAIGGALGVVGA